MARLKPLKPVQKLQSNEEALASDRRARGSTVTSERPLKKAQKLAQEADDEEVLETPSFFYDGPLADMTPRAFLAKLFWHYYPPTHTLHAASPSWRGKSHATLPLDEVSLDIEDEESLSSYASSDATETPEESESSYETGSETGSSSYESYTGSSSASDSAADDRSASSADDQSASAADDQSASSAEDVLGAGAAAGLAGAGAAAGAAAVGDASPGGHSAELDYDGPELGHDAELDYQGADGLPELLPRAAADAPAPRGFARPGDLSAGGMES